MKNLWNKVHRWFASPEGTVVIYDYEGNEIFKGYKMTYDEAIDDVLELLKPLSAQLVDASEIYEMIKELKNAKRT